MMLMSKHLRCKTTVLAFTFSVTVMLLLTDLTSVSYDKSIGIEYCQKYVKKYRRYLYRRYSKRIADTIGGNTNLTILTTMGILLHLISIQAILRKSGFIQTLLHYLNALSYCGRTLSDVYDCSLYFIILCFICIFSFFLFNLAVFILFVLLWLK